MSDEDLHVLSLSGGKDSVAAGLYLKEQGIEHVRVFMDTGWEHPDLYAHLDYLEGELGPIVRIQPKIPEIPDQVVADVEAIEAIVGRSPSGFVRWSVKKGMFASRRQRWCTQLLKVRPFLSWVEALDQEIVNVVGIRAAESAARSRLSEREEMPGAEHIEVWRPLIRWTEGDVIEIHRRHGIKPCPLYLRGSVRVGCWPCIQSGKSELRQLAGDARRLTAIRMLEDLVARLAAERGAAPPALFQSVVRMKDGSRPCIPIDRIVEWAQTSRGGRQMLIDTSWGRESGCVRWGMCEAPSE